MTAKIKIYNDNGDLVSKCEELPCYNKRIDYDDKYYEVRKYEFRFIYAEFVPKLLKGDEV